MAAVRICGHAWLYFYFLHPHMLTMVAWQKTNFTREPPKTKAELRQMLTEAVRNTQANADLKPKRLPKVDKIAAAVE